MTDLEIRLAKLERENRWMKRIGALVVMIAGVATVMGMAHQDEKVPDVVKAKKFELVDKNGNVRGDWVMDEGPNLTLYNKDLKSMVKLSVKDVMPIAGVYLYDGNKEKSKLRASLAFSHIIEDLVSLTLSNGYLMKEEESLKLQFIEDGGKWKGSLFQREKNMQDKWTLPK